MEGSGTLAASQTSQQHAPTSVLELREQGSINPASLESFPKCAGPCPRMPRRGGELVGLVTIAACVVLVPTAADEAKRVVVAGP